MSDPFEVTGDTGRVHTMVEAPPELDRGEPAATTEPPSQIWHELVRSPRFVLPGVVVLLMVLVAIFPAPFAGLFGHGDPRQCDLTYSAQGPTSGHPFGFDLQGCDLYANVVYGARPSMSIGVLVTAGIMLIAIVLGSVSGYVGGVLDAGVG